MKKILFVMMIICCGVVSANDFSISLKGGMTYCGVDSCDDGSNYGLAANYYFTDNWGIELQYLQSSVDFSASYSNSVDLDIDSIGLYGVYRNSFENDFYLKGKIGVSKNEGDVSYSSSSTGRDYDPIWGYYSYTRTTYGDFEVEETEFSAAIEAGWKPSENFTVGVEFSYLGEDLTSMDVSASYFFS